MPGARERRRRDGLQARSEVRDEDARDDREKQNWGKTEMDPARGASAVEEGADANDCREGEGEGGVGGGDHSQVVWGKGEWGKGGEEGGEVTEGGGVEARADAGGEPNQREQVDVEMAGA